jgi:hypothetical protein
VPLQACVSTQSQGGRPQAAGAYLSMTTAGVWDAILAAARGSGWVQEAAWGARLESVRGR